MLPQCQHQKVNKLGGQVGKGGGFASGEFIEIVGKRHKKARETLHWTGSSWFKWEERLMRDPPWLHPASPPQGTRATGWFISPGFRAAPPKDVVGSGGGTRIQLSTASGRRKGRLPSILVPLAIEPGCR